MTKNQNNNRNEIPRDAPTIVETIRLYDSLPVIYAENDIWHVISHDWITNYVKSSLLRISNLSQSICLNLGSGGESYGMPETNLLHVDLYTKGFNSDQRVVVADIQASLPFTKPFPICLCVGSVINHCDAAAVISNISEVMEPGGYLILEFETSSSLEHLATGIFGKQAVVVTTFYQGQSIRLWAYSERYIRELLATNGFSIVRRSSKHHLSSLAYLICRNSNFASRFHIFDILARHVPILNRWASHIIFSCQKSS